jgi:S1-C subfamily serine protease
MLLATICVLGSLLLGSSVLAASPAVTTSANVAQAAASDTSRQLRSIVIPEVDFRQAHIEEVRWFLLEQAKVNDPDMRGVTIVVTLPDDTRRRLLSDHDPFGAYPDGSLKDPQLRVSLNMANAPLGDVLQRCADQIGFESRVEGRAVILSPRTKERASPLSHGASKTNRVARAFIAGAKTYARLTTLTGATYEHVTVSAVERDSIYVKHKSGGGRIGLDELPDNVLADLGLPSRDEIARQEKKEGEDRQRFEAEQRAKGMVWFNGKWMTPSEIKAVEAERREEAYVAKADELVRSKALSRVSFKVLQALPNGALCVMARYDPTLEATYFTGETFFLLSATSQTLADNEAYTEDLYWGGTYTYTTVKDVEKTVNCFSHRRDLAQVAVRLKFGLFDTEEKTGPSASSGTAGDEPVVAGRELKGFGSGFIITKDGYLLTNHHVIRNAKQVKVKTENGIHPARVVARDPDNDIALLKIEGQFSPAAFAPEKVAKLGQTVFTVGFPMPELQGFSPKVTKGVVSSMNGIQDDVRMYQIDAAVQPGNSGGPLSDENGNIVGVVVARLNDALVAEATGSLAQNVNYAVKKSYTMAFVDNQPDASKQVQTAIDPKRIPFEDAVERIRKATVLVMVY